MKLMFCLITLFITASAWAARFSAFTDHGVLYATILGNTCNEHIGGLALDSTCTSENLASSDSKACKARLRVYAGMTECMPGVLPQVIQIDLQDFNVPPEADSIELTFMNETVLLSINR